MTIFPVIQERMTACFWSFALVALVLFRPTDALAQAWLKSPASVRASSPTT